MATPDISVICVTKRIGWSPIMRDDVFRQTFKNFDVIVADENYCINCDERNFYGPFDMFQPRPKRDIDVWNLNKAYNDCLDRARGELLVFLQDFIWIPDNGLQKFWEMYQKHPNALIAGVGHKAERGLEGISERDLRMDGSGERVKYTEWELNWAACPKKIMPRFNEEMDRWYGGENQYVAKKAMHLGAECLIDRTNVCIGYSQKECGGRPENWEPMHCNKEGRLASFLELLERTLPPIR